MSPTPNPIMCLVDSERRGLKLPTGHPFSQPSPRPPGQTGACLLSLGHKIQSDAWSARLWPVSWGEGGETAALIFDRMHLCGFRGLCDHWRKEVLPYFQDKVSFMRAMCWTNQVNWEAPNGPQWAHLSFLFKADSAVQAAYTYFCSLPKAHEICRRPENVGSADCHSDSGILL